jgi:GNAT superfamily N-acetyltransferase
MTWSIRRIGDDQADFAALVAVMTEVTPDEPTSLEELRWSDATYPGTGRFLAEQDGNAVAAATVGRIYMRPPDFDGLWAAIDVLPAVRRRGIGGGLYDAIASYARAAGKVALHVTTREDRAESVAFLERRGFVEYERMRLVALDLRGLGAPEVSSPEGVTITTLAQRPDLVAGVHAVAQDAFSDIPGGTEPIAAGTFDEFRARDVDRPGIPAEAFAIAVDDATGSVIGYASLIMLGGSTRAYHDMTAVLPAWRGRGVAGALKCATIAWAIGSGLEWLETGNDVANAPMRAVNARLGYRPLPDRIEFRGPVADTVAGTVAAPAAR